MATYCEIQNFVQRHHGFVPQLSWIAHVKVLRGLPVRRKANRAGRDRRVVPSPAETREAIEQAFRHFRSDVKTEYESTKRKGLREQGESKDSGDGP